LRFYLDFTTLTNIISECIHQALNEEMLCEMALPRKTYKEKVDGLIPQILENWCLVRYCSILGLEHNKSHWSDELRGHLLTVSRFSIKGNDSIQSRRKIFLEIWEENDYDKSQFLNMTIANKFLKEGFDLSSIEYEQAIKDCIDSEQKLFEAILSRDVEFITNYARTI